MAFVHLHNHTVFSMLDGATRIQDMVNRAVELGMPAVAITDHGYMYGVPDLALACDAVNHNTPEYKTWSHDKAFLEKDRRDELVEPDPEANPREHAQFNSAIDHILDTGCAVEHGEDSGVVQMDECHVMSSDAGSCSD